MRFSIVVPIYKVEEYLSQCVDSLLSQDYDNFEVILVDDGSPDNCPGICDAYAEKDARIKVVHKKNGGLSDARNAGIKVADGDYLCFVDSDDYWDDDLALQKLAKSIQLHNSDVCQHFRKIYITSADEVIVPHRKSFLSLNDFPTQCALRELTIRGDIAISACSIVIRKTFLLEHDLFFKKGIKSEDLEWAIRLFASSPKFSFLDDAFFVYRKNRPGSITATVDYSHLCDYCDILKDSIMLVENGKEELKDTLLSYLMYHLLILTALCYRVDLQKAQRKEIFARLKVICRQYLLENTLDKKVKLAAVIYRCFGFSVMAKILGFYLNNRGR